MTPNPALLETILESLEEAVFALDTDGCITSVNTAAERLLGQSRGHMLGQLFVDVCPVDEAFRSALSEVRRGETTKLSETTLTMPDRRETPMAASATVTPLFPVPNPEVPPDAAGTPQGAVITLRDIRRMRELEELVRRSDQVHTIGTVAAGLAHEIKNPLSGIRGAAQLLKRSIPPEEHEGCDLILREVDRLRSLVEELLDAGHPRALSLAPINVHQVLHRALSLIPALQQGAIELVQEYDPSLPDIWGDADALQQVFLNLLTNAVDAIAADAASGYTPPPRGAVTVQTSLVVDAVRLERKDHSHKGTAVVRIADTGHGIAPETLPRLFTPFFTTKHDGAGLGLVISHRIVTEHGGGIHVESLPDTGAAFTVYLPLAPSNRTDTGP